MRRDAARSFAPQPGSIAFQISLTAQSPEKAASAFNTLSDFFDGQEFKKVLNGKNNSYLKFVTGTKSSMFCSGKWCKPTAAGGASPDIRVENFIYSEHSFLMVRNTPHLLELDVKKCSFKYAHMMLMLCRIAEGPSSRAVWRLLHGLFSLASEAESSGICQAAMPTV
jgi:hypothetical protein